MPVQLPASMPPSRLVGHWPPMSQAPVLDERAAFTFGAQTEHLELADHLEGHRVVERKHVDVGGRDAGVAERTRGRSLAEVAHLRVQRRVRVVALKELHAAAEHAHRMLRQVARALGGGDDERGSRLRSSGSNRVGGRASRSSAMRARRRSSPAPRRTSPPRGSHGRGCGSSPTRSRSVPAWCRTRACGAWRPARTAPSRTIRTARRTRGSCSRRATCRRSRTGRRGRCRRRQRRTGPPRRLQRPSARRARRRCRDGGCRPTPAAAAGTCAQFSASRGAPPGPGQSIAAPSTSRGVRPASAIAPFTASITMSCEVRPGRVRACFGLIDADDGGGAGMRHGGLSDSGGQAPRVAPPG